MLPGADSGSRHNTACPSDAVKEWEEDAGQADSKRDAGSSFDAGSEDGAASEDSAGSMSESASGAWGSNDDAACARSSGRPRPLAVPRLNLGALPLSDAVATSTDMGDGSGPDSVQLLAPVVAPHCSGVRAAVRSSAGSGAPVQRSMSASVGAPIQLPGPVAHDEDGDSVTTGDAANGAGGLLTGGSGAQASASDAALASPTGAWLQRAAAASTASEDSGERSASTAAQTAKGLGEVGPEFEAFYTVERGNGSRGRDEHNGGGAGAQRGDQQEPHDQEAQPFFTCAPATGGGKAAARVAASPNDGGPAGGQAAAAATASPAELGPGLAKVLDFNS